jgi:hypothetical protein
MLLKEVIAGFFPLKIKMQSYQLLEQVGHIVTTGFKGLMMLNIIAEVFNLYKINLR